jgi:hypothetical protein
MNNGAPPREVGDIPCGGLPEYYLLSRNLTKYTREWQNTTHDKRTTLLNTNHVNLIYYIHRSLTDLTDVRLPQYPYVRVANANRDLDVSYLMGTITHEEWAKHLEQGETKFERKREIGQVLQTLVHVGSEKMTEISNILQVSVAGSGRIKEILEELEQLRVFSNDALKKRGKEMGIVVPQITPDEWRWSMTRREAKKKAVDDRSTSGSDDEVEVLPNPTATAATTNA